DAAGSARSALRLPTGAASAGVAASSDRREMASTVRRQRVTTSPPKPAFGGCPKPVRPTMGQAIERCQEIEKKKD
ncbi:hypothetical protein B8W90_13240, partial [Staphylococcus hominis]